MRVAILSSLAAALLLSGCVVPTGPVEVTRFNRVAEGAQYGSGSYSVRLADQAALTGEGNAGSGGELAASPYLAAVSREMQRAGYSEASGGSDVVAEVSVTVRDLGKRQSRGPVSVGVGGSTGGYRSGVGVGVGLDLTSLLNRPKARILTEISVRILKPGEENTVIWEGRAAQEASAGSPAAQPGIAASKLAEALFQGFPGESGETITVP